MTDETESDFDTRELTDSIDGVRATLDIEVPARFDHELPGGLVATFVVQEGDLRLLSIRFARDAVNIDVDENGKAVSRLDVEGVCPDVGALEAFDWSELFREALMRQLVGAHLAQGAPSGDDGERRWIAEAQQITRTAERASGRSRVNNRWSSEFAHKVAAAYRTGGAEAVAEESHVSIRQARRYVERATEEGLL